jgi:hypothetical protein
MGYKKKIHYFFIIFGSGFRLLNCDRVMDQWWQKILAIVMVTKIGLPFSNDWIFIFILYFTFEAKCWSLNYDCVVDPLQL